uniref:BPTI/Kunitz inhibitor domain-containing protein n=1 Tax=Astyanax mexicanus TaxID=7994 RepID=A0A3B1IUE8_ASTMX
MSEGHCSDFTLLWYFHSSSGGCRPFVYSGCGGNGNRFSTKHDCLSHCSPGWRGDERALIPSESHTTVTSGSCCCWCWSWSCGSRCWSWSCGSRCWSWSCGSRC